jgi:hypothetical protein
VIIDLIDSCSLSFNCSKLRKKCISWDCCTFIVAFSWLSSDTCVQVCMQVIERTTTRRFCITSSGTGLVRPMPNPSGVLKFRIQEIVIEVISDSPWRAALSTLSTQSRREIIPTPGSWSTASYPEQPEKVSSPGVNPSGRFLLVARSWQWSVSLFLF